MIHLHSFDDPDAQAGALARAVAQALAEPAQAEARRTLALSGGTSPRRFFEYLARTDVDWAAVDLTLVDDRWVAEHDAASNAALLRATLLQGAAGSSFLPLVDVAQDPARHVASLNRDSRYRQPDVAVLGMGEDGHTASLFADAPEWAAVLATQDRYVLVHPGAAPHARVSLSMDALIHTRRLFLLISGTRKLEVLQQAVAGSSRNAISKLANHEGVQIDVYWCAD